MYLQNKSDKKVHCVASQFYKISPQYPKKESLLYWSVHPYTLSTPRTEQLHDQTCPFNKCLVRKSTCLCKPFAFDKFISDGMCPW